MMNANLSALSYSSDSKNQAVIDRKVSVVMPAYNSAQYIREALESVFNQDFLEIEIIVVDDGSTDETPVILSGLTDPRLRVIRQENMGVSSARNRGINECSASRIVFFDADDLLIPQAISKLAACFDQDPKIVLAYGEAITFSDTDGILNEAKSPTFAPRPKGDILEQIIQANPMCCGAVMVCRDVIAATGGFDAKIHLGEDWLMWCTMAALGRVAYAGPSPILYYRIHGGSAARRLAKDPKAMWPAIQSVFALPAVQERFPDSIRAKLRRRSEASALAYIGREFLKDRQWREARHAFFGALKRRPTKTGEWILLGCALVGILPKLIQRRIK